jgi:serine/threonine protein kinase/tetratricopeptide (TPR) repeat protein
MTNAPLREMVSSAGLSEEQTAQVLRILEEYLAELERGRRPHPEELLARHPDVADVLKDYLDRLDLLHDAAVRFRVMEPPDENSGANSNLGRLGDFELVREIGRGGMGIVYEAQQISLKRRVALKVLPFAATMDQRQLGRFQNEARAAAGLHHSNIVPVYFVGCERGVNYYAMQFIEGRDLASIITNLRARNGRKPRPSQAPTQPQRRNGRHAGPAKEARASHPPVSAAADTQPVAGLSTESRQSQKHYFQSVARLGTQAAEALDYAHQQGIVHRDVKPANLLLDGDLRLWVTDFGLAHIQGDSALTMTGDLVGTLRFMSPEQALAKRVVVDHRTDIYSLGVTLYELLTLQPAFNGGDRQEILRQIAFEEPRRPRQFNKAIPQELETIVQKAIEKNPADRYGTAQELADDLRNWLHDRPIRARRPGWRQVALKWARRNRALVAAATVVLVVIALFGGGSWLWWTAKVGMAETDARAALQEALALHQEEKWPEALSAARRAQGLLAGVAFGGELRQQVDDLCKDLEMAERLEKARLQRAALKKYNLDFQAEHDAFSQAFSWYGLEVAKLSKEQIVERLQGCSIRPQIGIALDEWAEAREEKDDERRAVLHLRRTAHAVDPDPRRNELRDWLLGRTSGKALINIIASLDNDDLLPATAVFLVRATSKPEKSLQVLRKVQQRHPADFWVNLQLGMSTTDPQEQIRYLTAAVASRPLIAFTHVVLGETLGQQGLLDEAISEFRQAIRLNGDSEVAYGDLAHALNKKALWDGAIGACQKAIGLNKDFLPHLYHQLGLALGKKGRWDEAIAAYQRAFENFSHIAGEKKRDLEKVEFRLKSRLHDRLATVLFEQKKDINTLLRENREALRINPRDALAHFYLAAVLYGQDDRREAMRHLKEAAEIDFMNIIKREHINLPVDLNNVADKQAVLSSCNAALGLIQIRLAKAFEAKGDVTKAREALADGMLLIRDDAGANNNLAWGLATTSDGGPRDPSTAVALAKRAIQLDPMKGDYFNTLGVAHYRNGDWKEAIAALERAPGLEYQRNAWDYYCLAMAHWKLGNKDQARSWYSRGSEWLLDNPAGEEMRRLRAEAAELLGIDLAHAKSKN